MALERSICSHCRRTFGTGGTENIYSIIVVEEHKQIQIISGSLETDAFHYCSDKCMFDRDQGSVTYERYLELIAEINSSGETNN
jgi:hypothetical protein